MLRFGRIIMSRYLVWEVALLVCLGIQRVELIVVLCVMLYGILGSSAIFFWAS